MDGGITSEKGGLLFPRVVIDDITSLNVFEGLSDAEINTDEQKKVHIGLTVYNITPNLQQNIEEGIYVWGGKRWEKSTYRQRTNFFYMPSIEIDTSTPGDKTPINLYDAYRTQFESPRKPSTGAPAQIPFYYSAGDLYYYVTEFDDTVFDESKMSIDADGTLHYSILNAAQDGTSYINVVFVVK